MIAEPNPSSTTDRIEIIFPNRLFIPKYYEPKIFKKNDLAKNPIMRVVT